MLCLLLEATSAENHFGPQIKPKCFHIMVCPQRQCQAICLRFLPFEFPSRRHLEYN